ncbi:unnamed protein product [Microthlaspi erraticum]|uniref:Integrase catalytic domain-containing protein n=1 Tax=Microthlaspi erraticum TaxID=1685480 RepID=A0A6D2HJ77_9BRAS|nr:unnamed protein product [Microthlaspi erraticum]
MQVESIGGKRYVFVLVDDYSRYTWVRFIRDKSDTMASFKIWALQVITEKGSLKRIRSDHGGEFQNEVMTKFCNDQGIAHQFSAPRTPQMNGVVERKNRTLQEMARAMIHGGNIPVKFWAEAINTACLLEHSGAYGTQGAWRDLAHGSSSTGYAKEEGRSHLEDQLDRPLDQPVEFLNSTGQASTRSSWGVKVKPEKCCFPLDFPLTLNLILFVFKGS